MADAPVTRAAVASGASWRKPSLPIAARQTIRQSPAARRALRDLHGTSPLGDRVPPDVLARALNNQHMLPFLAGTLPALSAVRTVPGVEIALKRAAESNLGSAAGGSYEISVAAAIGHRLAAIDAMVSGNEVDFLLRDGTVVEAKFDTGGWQRKLERRALEQIKVRQATGRDVALVVNWRMRDALLRELDTNGVAVYQASHGTGLVRQLASGTTLTRSPLDHVALTAH